MAENRGDDGGGVKLLLLKVGEEMEWEERKREKGMVGHWEKDELDLLNWFDKWARRGCRK